MIKNLPAMQETCVGPLGWEDPLEEEMATHSSILAWRILWTEEPRGLQSMGKPRVRHSSNSFSCECEGFELLFPFFLEQRCTKSSPCVLARNLAGTTLN